jgi:putative NADPH-quinone reductase
MGMFYAAAQRAHLMHVKRPRDHWSQIETCVFQQSEPLPMTKICIIQGHPHFSGNHLCHALAAAYRQGAITAGHQVEVIDIAGLSFEVLRDPQAMTKPPSEVIIAAETIIRDANHLMIIYPLWLGTMPALVKAFFEQMACGEFMIGKSEKGWPIGKLKGRSARLVVTMGMPAIAYKALYGAHGVRGFESGVLGMAGIGPIRETLFGGVDMSAKQRSKWIAKMATLGAAAR